MREPVESSEILTEGLLMRLKNHHLPTYEHSIRVANMALELGQIYGFADQNSQKILVQAAKLHDIGKLTVSAQTLDKDKPLEIEERMALHYHSKAGDTLSKALFNGLLVPVSEHVRNYHESGKYSESDTFNDNDIIRLIIKLADIFDACMDDKRAYKKPLKPDEAKTVIRKGFFERRIFHPVLEPIFETWLCQSKMYGMNQRPEAS